MQTIYRKFTTAADMHDGHADGAHEDDLNRARLRVATLSAELAAARDELKRIEAARGIP